MAYVYKYAVGFHLSQFMGMWVKTKSTVTRSRAETFTGASPVMPTISESVGSLIDAEYGGSVACD